MTLPGKTNAIFDAGRAIETVSKINSFLTNYNKNTVMVVLTNSEILAQY